MRYNLLVQHKRINKSIIYLHKALVFDNINVRVQFSDIYITGNASIFFQNALKSLAVGALPRPCWGSIHCSSGHIADFGEEWRG